MNYTDIQSIVSELHLLLFFNLLSVLLLHFFAPKIALKAFKLLEKSFMPFLRAILITITLNTFLNLLFEYLRK
jgi:hypothetical protein